MHVLLAHKAFIHWSDHQFEWSKNANEDYMGIKAIFAVQPKKPNTKRTKYMKLTHGSELQQKNHI